METIVETFLQEDVKSLIYEPNDLGRWHDLVKELKLKGQEFIVQYHNLHIPFPKMNSHMIDALGSLFYSRAQIADFYLSTIPLEILELVSHCIKKNLFSRIEIWWNDTNSSSMVVGQIGYWNENGGLGLNGKIFSTKQEALDAGGQGPRFHTISHYLIGRWGTDIQPIDEQKELVKARFMVSETMEKILMISPKARFSR